MKGRNWLGEPLARTDFDRRTQRLDIALYAVSFIFGQHLKMVSFPLKSLQQKVEAGKLGAEIGECDWDRDGGMPVAETVTEVGLNWEFVLSFRERIDRSSAYVHRPCCRRKTMV